MLPRSASAAAIRPVLSEIYHLLYSYSNCFFATMSAAAPTHYDLVNELSSVTNWEMLAIYLGLEMDEVETIKKDIQVYFIVCT